LVISFFCRREGFVGFPLVCVGYSLPSGFLLFVFWVVFLNVSSNLALATFCFGCLRLGSFGFVCGGVVSLPLTESVSFKVKLQVGNRFQAPRLVRWQFRLEPSQLLKVQVRLVGAFGMREDFLARMSQDGRITIPRLIAELLTEEGEDSLVGYALEVALLPVETSS
jgi:hypothetical protein